DQDDADAASRALRCGSRHDANGKLRGRPRAGLLFSFARLTRPCPRDTFAMLKPAVNVMVKAARLGGNVLLRSINRLDALTVVQKQRMDYASEVDADAELAIVKELRRAYPDYGVLGEEGG